MVVRNFDRSDSMVVHEEKGKKGTSTTNLEIETSNQEVEANATTTIQSLLQNIRDETEKYFVTHEGKLLYICYA